MNTWQERGEKLLFLFFLRTTKSRSTLNTFIYNYHIQKSLTSFTLIGWPKKNKMIKARKTPRRAVFVSACCAYLVPGPAPAEPGPWHSPRVLGWTGMHSWKASSAHQYPVSSLSPMGLARACFQMLSFPSTHFPLISSTIPTTKKWLHTVPVLNFFVPGATSHFLQLFTEPWPFHLLYSHRTSLSSHNLPFPGILICSSSQTYRLSWLGGLSIQIPITQSNNYFLCKALNFPGPSAFFNFNLVKVLFNPTMHSRIQFVWKMIYKIKFYCIIC